MRPGVRTGVHEELIHPCFGDLFFVEECFPETWLLAIGQHSGEVRWPAVGFQHNFTVPDFVCECWDLIEALIPAGQVLYKCALSAL